MFTKSAKCALAAMVAVAAGAGVANAADTPRAAPPPRASVAPEPPLERVADWTGFYLGVHGTWAQLNVDGPGGGNDLSDLGGGIQGGFNYQFDRNFVAGLEADYTFIEETGTQSVGPGAFYTNTLDGLGSLRARAGIAAGRVLFYLTGGLAFGEVTSFASPSGVTDETNFGWVAGGGIEGLITDNVTARAEYLYYDLGEVNVPTAADVNVHAVRLGLNYKFSLR